MLPPPMPPSQPWVVTGATGRVGRMLMRAWRMHPPLGLHLIPQQRPPGDGSAALIWSPLADGPAPLVALAARVGGGGLGGMIVLSGVTPATPGALTDNVALATAMVSAAQAAGVPRLIVASTSAIYGAGRGVPIPEDAPPAPANPYGMAKLAAELVYDAAVGRGLAVCQLRIGNVAGADVLLLNALRATAERPLQLDRFADGCGPRRSYIGPATLAQVIARLAILPAAALPGHLNIGAPTPVTMESLARAAGVIWQDVPAPPTAHQNITLDCSRLSALYDFAADAADPVAMVAEWHRLKDPA
jgi:UDP-glucose 4-epimerase